MSTDDTAIRAAFKLADETRAAALAAFHARYVEGAPVRWVYGSRGETQSGVVVEPSRYSERLRVLNEQTGREYWVHGWRVVAAL